MDAQKKMSENAPFSSEFRQRIVEAAIDLYLHNPARFTVSHICEGAGVSRHQFYRAFGSKERALEQFYPLCVTRYREIVAMMDDHAGMTLAEKLANFIYILFDFFQEQREFVSRTFEEMCRRKSWRQKFEAEIRQTLREILESEERVAMLQRTFLLNSITYDWLTGEYFSLVRFWLGDDSENYAKTMAYADKLVNFLAEVLEMSVVDRGFDLAKFMVQHNLENIPVINWFIKKTDYS